MHWIFTVAFTFRACTPEYFHRLPALIRRPFRLGKDPKLASSMSRATQALLTIFYQLDHRHLARIRAKTPLQVKP